MSIDASAASTPQGAAPAAVESPMRGLPASSGRTPVVNDMVISIATSNGTGSQSANNILMRTIFNMGVPVGGKNLFPSNIQGLPTWFDIRVNRDSFTCRRAGVDVLVAMNAESARDDIAGLRPGAILVINEDMKAFINRDDLVIYVVPFSKLVVPICPDGRLRRLVINMMYVGVVAWLLHMDIEQVKNAINKQFGKKPTALELNQNAAVGGYEWAAENLDKQDLFAIERMSGKAEGKVIMDGNMAAALGLLYGGVGLLSWYPITPSSSVCENLIAFLGRYRHDEEGKATYAVVQAEDELAAIGMVVGAGWAGVRAVTATSGPGISLMAEFAGLSYFAEIPAVIVDVQRMGPSTGLPTRTCQGDIAKAYNLSHGDCKHVLLIPGNLQEAFEFGIESLNLAERLQTLVFLMLDLDMGMNNYMVDPLKLDSKPLDRGKVLDAAALDKVAEFARYRDVDGDGIPYRTVPGTPHPKAAFFTRGTGHTDRATYSEKPEDWQSNMDRLVRKFNTARKITPQPVIQTQDHATVAIIAYGSSDEAIAEARARMENEHGIKSDYLRIRALPLSEDVRKFIVDHDRVIVIEQNRDAQMTSIIHSDYPDLAPRVHSLLHYDGLPLDAQTVITGVIADTGNIK